MYPPAGAVVLAALALSLTHLLAPRFGGVFYFASSVAVTLAALLFGIGPGLLATAVSALGYADRLAIPPTPPPGFASASTPTLHVAKHFVPERASGSNGLEKLLAGTRTWRNEFAVTGHGQRSRCSLTAARSACSR